MQIACFWSKADTEGPVHRLLCTLSFSLSFVVHEAEQDRTVYAVNTTPHTHTPLQEQGQHQPGLFNFPFKLMAVGKEVQTSKKFIKIEKNTERQKDTPHTHIQRDATPTHKRKLMVEGELCLLMHK